VLAVVTAPGPANGRTGTKTVDGATYRWNALAEIWQRRVT